MAEKFHVRVRSGPAQTVYLHCDPLENVDDLVVRFCRVVGERNPAAIRLVGAGNKVLDGEKRVGRFFKNGDAAAVARGDGEGGWEDVSALLA